MSSNENVECCPEFNPAPWDDKIVEWDNKKFIKDHVCTLFYMPMNFGKVMKRLSTKIDNAGACVTDWMCLSDHTSKWNMDVYLEVDKEVADAENTTISGKMFTKVYEGPFKDTGKWHKDFESILKTKNFTAKKIYMWYTTCPKCAKKYGKNYTVFVAQI